MSRAAFNTDLGIPESPDFGDPKLDAAIAPVHNALRALASNLDALTGTSVVYPSEYATSPPATQMMYGNGYKLYRKCQANVEAYRFVAFNGATELVRHSVLADMHVGLTLAAAKAGEYVPILVRGVINIPGIVFNTLYYSDNVGRITISASGGDSHKGFGTGQLAIVGMKGWLS